MQPEDKKQREANAQKTEGRITEAFNTIDATSEERKADDAEAWRLANELTKIVPRPFDEPASPRRGAP